MIINRGLFVTGIGTGVGKTVVSAILTQYFQADYWKPIQSGDLDQSDSMTVDGLIDSHLNIYPERFRLKLAVSPHQAAREENISIGLGEFKLPENQRSLIVEGAGGLFVPINDHDFIIDLIGQLGLPVVLVVRDYLGCINHTLLSVHALQSRNIPIAYLVFNGQFNPATKDILVKHMPLGTAAIQLPEICRLTPESVRLAALELKKSLQCRKS